MPLLSVTFTMAPAVWPSAASKLAVSTLNSCTAPAGGTNATRRPLAMFGDPSSVNSLPPVDPSALIDGCAAVVERTGELQVAGVRDTGHQPRQHERVAVGEGHQRDALLVDDLPRGRGREIQERRLRRDRHRLFEPADSSAKSRVSRSPMRTSTASRTIP